MNNHLLASRTFLTTLLSCSLSLLLSGCLLSPNKPELTLQQHKLVGKIWDIKHQAFIDKPAVLERLSGTRYLLLGERHDNPVHHQHQTWFIQQLSAKQIQASVAFEMIDTDQAIHLAEQPRSADQLISILNQFETSWQYETYYHDLFSEVIAADYPIDAANLNRKQLMQISMQGEEKLPDTYKRMLKETQFSNAQLRSLQEEIKQAHCQMLDDSMANKMVLGQRLRDAVMAHSLSTSQSAVKVLIAGSGHVRNDRGVPIYLDDNSNVLTVGIMEVESGVYEAGSYAERWGSEALPFDIIWFTPKIVRDDPCEVFKQHIKKQVT